jgi:hypothetical protein
MHSLSVNVETNLLSLVSPWLDKFCQITTKDATVTFHQLNTLFTKMKLRVRSSVQHCEKRVAGDACERGNTNYIATCKRVCIYI